MRILVDSSLIIDHLRIHQRQKTTRLMKIYKKSENLFFSLISIGEILAGQSAEKFETEIKKIFDLGNIINLNIEIMQKAGKIRRETQISLLDAIIAASALEFDLPLATLNIKDFSKVPKLKLYKI